LRRLETSLEHGWKQNKKKTKRKKMMGGVRNKNKTWHLQAPVLLAGTG